MEQENRPATKQEAQLAFKHMLRLVNENISDIEEIFENDTDNIDPKALILAKKHLKEFQELRVMLLPEINSDSPNGYVLDQVCDRFQNTHKEIKAYQTAHLNS